MSRLIAKSAAVTALLLHCMLGCSPVASSPSTHRDVSAQDTAPSDSLIHLDWLLERFNERSVRLFTGAVEQTRGFRIMHDEYFELDTLSQQAGVDPTAGLRPLVASMLMMVGPSAQALLSLVATTSRTLPPHLRFGEIESEIQFLQTSIDELVTRPTFGYRLTIELLAERAQSLQTVALNQAYEELGFAQLSDEDLRLATGINQSPVGFPESQLADWFLKGLADPWAREREQLVVEHLLQIARIRALHRVLIGLTSFNSIDSEATAALAFDDNEFHEQGELRSKLQQLMAIITTLKKQGHHRKYLLNALRMRQSSLSIGYDQPYGDPIPACDDDFLCLGIQQSLEDIESARESSAYETLDALQALLDRMVEHQSVAFEDPDYANPTSTAFHEIATLATVYSDSVHDLLSDDSIN